MTSSNSGGMLFETVFFDRFDGRAPLWSLSQARTTPGWALGGLDLKNGKTAC